MIGLAIGLGVLGATGLAVSSQRRVPAAVLERYREDPVPDGCTRTELEHGRCLENHRLMNAVLRHPDFTYRPMPVRWVMALDRFASPC